MMDHQPHAFKIDAFKLRSKFKYRCVQIAFKVQISNIDALKINAR